MSKELKRFENIWNTALSSQFGRKYPALHYIFGNGLFVLENQLKIKFKNFEIRKILYLTIRYHKGVITAQDKRREKSTYLEYAKTINSAFSNAKKLNFQIDEELFIDYRREMNATD